MCKCGGERCEGRDVRGEFKWKRLSGSGGGKRAIRHVIPKGERI